MRSARGEKQLLFGFAKIAIIFAATALGTSLAHPSQAQADDDLLSILSGTGGSSVVDGKAVQATPLRKVLQKPTAEQNIFLQFVESGELEKALFQWPVAFDGTPFAKTASGRALNAWVLFKNGIEVTAVESLLAIEKPEEIAPEIKVLWKDAAPDSHRVWASVNTSSWSPVWSEVFGIGTEVRVRGRQIYGAGELELVKELIRKTNLDSRERAWLEWQLVLGLATGEDAATAAKALSHLMTVKNNPVGQDLMTVTAARLLYQNGYLDAAVKYYEKVPKTSDYWFDAQEEMGWAFIRKGEPQNAIAVTATLANPAFLAQVGPEPLFLRALSQLKVCDYTSVVTTLNLFRDRYKERAKVLVGLIDKPDTPAVKALVSRMKISKVSLEGLGAEGAKLPRFVTRDESLHNLVQTETALETEGKIAGDLYARSLSGGTGQVGFQARLDQFRQSVEARVAGARSATMGRVKALAEEEVNEISGILQKLHIVEAEVLQQVALADRVSGANAVKKASEKRGTTGSRSEDRIWFPAESETWFDELANYRVDVKKGCESIKR